MSSTEPAKTPAETNPLVRSVLRGALGLGLFAVITAGLIALTQTLTADRIAEQIRRAQAGALLEIIPADQHDNDLLSDTFDLTDTARLGLQEPTSGYRARRLGQVTGIIIPVTAPEGYSGAIKLLIGISAQGYVLGVRNVEHHETPGLGDKIELKKSDWILSFNHTSRTAPTDKRWLVRKDGGEFDQFTGATITPRAVVKAVHQALLWFDDHKTEVLLQANDSPAPPVNSPATGIPSHE